MGKDYNILDHMLYDMLVHAHIHAVVTNVNIDCRETYLEREI